ncbi:hypothetical protein [Methylobacterium sp. CM6244]
MSTTQNDRRNRVIAQIANVMENAMAKGCDAHVAARSAFPGVPEEVLWKAFYEAEDPRIEAWWGETELLINVNEGEKSTNVLTFEPISPSPREAELDAAFEALLAGREDAQ